MSKEKFQSLSFKIMISIIITFFIIMTGIFLSLKKINKEAFYNIELQKAQLIVKTIEPLIAINIYLGLEGKLHSLLDQVMQNKDILGVKITQNGNTLYEVDFDKKDEILFVLKKDILQPGSQKKMATIELQYANHNYMQLLNNYNKLLIAMLVVLGIIFVMLSLYIERMLKPLREVTRLLQDFSPQKKLDIKPMGQKNEISLILSALGEMQEKVFEFANQQKNLNEFLEEQVNEKTQELRRQLYIDDLTKLPNRKKLFDDIQNSKDDGALLILNIDDFKEINDFYGQSAGDYILIEFAKKLNHLIEEEKNISLSRLSGDEFALLFKSKPSYRTFMRVVNDLTRKIEKTVFEYDQSEIFIRVTFGGTMESNEMLEKADIALKLAKEQKKYFLMYDEKLDIKGAYRENMEWVKKLKSAIKEDRIVPFFQPIFDTHTSKAVSYECLIRLIDTDGSVVSPFKFLNIALKSKIYPQLTRIMIEKSCQYFQNRDTTFSINLSINDIIDKEMVLFIQKSINKYGVSKKMVFEILETEGIDNYEEVSSFIMSMKQIGCKTSIDDFGSGYSNYEHILKLDVDYIKIDGSLIKNIDKDENVQIIVETIVSFAKKLNLMTVAEFVYNQTVFEKVKSLNIDRMQGFYLAEPEREIQED